MSLLLAASPLADDGTIIPPVLLLEWLPEELESPDYYTSFEVILCAPLEDNAVSEDYYQQPVIFDGEADVLAAESELQPDFWATPPPSQDDEWISPLVIDAPDADDEDATVTAAWPLDDAPVVDTDYILPFIADAGDEAEADADIILSAPADSDDEYIQALVIEAGDEDDTDAEVWAQSPPDEPVVATDDDIVPIFLADDTLEEVETDDSQYLTPLEDTPVLADDGYYCTIWTEDGFEEVVEDPSDYEIQTFFNYDETLTDQGVAYGWTTHFYSKRKRKKRKPEDVEEFYHMLETQGLDEAPAQVVEQAEEARKASQAFIHDDSKVRLEKALAEINAFYALVRAEVERRRREADDEEAEEILLLMW